MSLPTLPHPFTVVPTDVWSIIYQFLGQWKPLLVTQGLYDHFCYRTVKFVGLGGWPWKGTMPSLQFMNNVEVIECRLVPTDSGSPLLEFLTILQQLPSLLPGA